MKFVVAGLTHLGVCMSIAAHEAGLDVIAFDTNEKRVEEVKQAHFDTAEPGVVDFLKNRYSTYTITDRVEDIAGADLVMLALDTELGDDGQNDDLEVIRLLEFLAMHVHQSVPIVIASQVRPGFSRRHMHLHPELYYFMETLIFGRGLERAMRPERYIVGCADAEQDLPKSLLSYLALPRCPIHVMSYESAELTKLSANYVLAANITAANSLADLAQRIGADWHAIEEALRSDGRIGQDAYISAGLGIGGANLSRDLHGIAVMSDQLGANSAFTKTMLHHSNYMRDWVLRTIIDLRQEQPVSSLAILGLAYKPGTQSTRGSSGLDLLVLFESCMQINVHDPSVVLEPRPQGSRAKQLNDAMEAITSSQLIAVTTPWPEYVEILRKFLRVSTGSVVIDPYRVVQKSWAIAPGCRIIQLGVADV